MTNFHKSCSSSQVFVSLNSLFGFSISDSVDIRKNLLDLINKKCSIAIDEALDKAEKHAKEISRYRRTKVVEQENVFTKEQLEDYSKYSDKKVKQCL